MSKNILILEGGFNEEHEISLSTAKEVKKALIELNYNLRSIVVNPTNFQQKIKKIDIDICFNALHGPFGEDGNIQRILYDNKIRYTHSGINASKIAFNKFLTKEAIKKTEISFLKSYLISNLELNQNLLLNIFNKIGSFVLKPLSSGSSFGVKIFRSIEDINYLNKSNFDELSLYKNHNKLLIEPYINGKELTVAVIEENKKSQSIAVTEIVSNNLFFDYDAKYTKGHSQHILPANIPDRVYKKCLIYAKLVHDILGCKGISRSDFIYEEEQKKLYFLEINTQPGLTQISLVPEQLKYINIDFFELIEKLLKASSCQK